MFTKMNRDEILDFFKDSKYTIRKFSKSDVIAIEGDICENIGLILKGHVDIKRMLSNKVIQVTTVSVGNLFGEIIAFSDVNTYPATVISATASEILFISKDDFIKFCSSHNDFLKMFFSDLTNKILILNKSIERLSYNSIRQKMSNYILDEYHKQNSLFINLNSTKQKLSEILGIPRPSLSRELINMKDLGIIDYSKDTIKILDLESLKSLCNE